MRRNAAAARAAETEFYGRHARYLYCVLVQRVRRPLALSGREVEDLVQETFFRAFARAETYSGGDAWDRESQSRRSRAWLGRIAERLLADWLADARPRLRRSATARRLAARPVETAVLAIQPRQDRRAA